MKFGFIQIYNEVNWIGYAIDQAVKLCDKILIMEGAQYTNFPDIPERSNDGTLDIINDKTRQYPGIIKVMNTTRDHANYRINQSQNFNLGLSLCNKGDYFIMLDADEFYTDACISEMNELMEENEIEAIYIDVNFFMFSFKWLLDYGTVHSEEIAIKNVDGFHFRPTSQRINVGKRSARIGGSNRFHYKLVKPKARLLTRMRTSMRYKGMVEWLEDAWQTLRLVDGVLHKDYHTNYTLHRYDGEHPGVLDNHPWRHIEDIRRLND